MSNWTDRINQAVGATTYAQLEEAIERARTEVWRFTAAIKDQATALESTKAEVTDLLGEIRRDIGRVMGEVTERLRAVEADVAVLRARGDIDEMNDGRIVLG
ncbi:MAG TPA: hypothetical protein VGB52_10905 [Actinomycetota bacterium]